MLKQAGFTWRNGRLIDPKGKPVAMRLIPTFYLAEADIMARDFRQLGIDVTIENLQFGTYYDKLQKGDFDAADGWTNGGPTPYVYYWQILDSSNYAPIGQSAPWAWERWKNPQMDKLFAEFRRTLDPRRQHELADQMQRLFVQYLPVIPTVTETISMAYKTDNYTGWPTLRNPYAYGIYSVDTGLILTHLRRTH
jgi:peptide/nickel transport system substrate-binding protein